VSEYRNDGLLSSAMSGGNLIKPDAEELKNPVISNQWFHDQEIKLDGWHFKSCRFDNCSFRLDTPYFAFEDCFVDENSAMTLSHYLVDVIKLFHLRNKHVRETDPYFAPVFNVDGTFSIGVK
jgi:hypothetical protein